MAGLNVHIMVTTSGGDLADWLLNEAKLRVKHSPGACAPCRANDNPMLVPFPGCNSNRRGGNGCKCTVVVEGE